MSQKDTVTLILDAAEILFAEQGFSETSLRTITSAAGVNLSAVNYHFGSKKGLIQAVFVRYLDPLTQHIAAKLAVYSADEAALSTKKLLIILTEAVYEVHGHSAQRVATFMRLLSLAYTQFQGHLRTYLDERYGPVFRRFVGLLRPAADLSDLDLFWNVHFALGAAIFTLSNQQALADLLESDTGIRTDMNQLITRLVSFMISGIETQPLDATIVSITK